ANFSREITDAVESSDVMLAVIGPQWLTVRDSHARRQLDDPSDPVRLEIETALARNIQVIPILVDGAPMPPVQALPPTLAPLADRNALELRPAHFNADIGRLTEALERSHPALAQPPRYSEPTSGRLPYPTPLKPWESSQPIVYDDLIRRFFAEE